MTATSSSGAGIGGGGFLNAEQGGDGGDITIDGSASVTATTSLASAAIGGGGGSGDTGGDGGTIRIGGDATVTADSGVGNGAAIGGAQGGDGGSITIDGSAVVNADGSIAGGAGIGGGLNGNGGTTTIGGDAEVTATARNGAGIGGGTLGGGGVITIRDRALVDAGAVDGNGAGIGGGPGGPAGVITITDEAQVTAVSAGSAAIGGDTRETAPADSISISGRSSVSASGTSNASGIGGSATITVTGGPTVVATSEYSAGIARSWRNTDQSMRVEIAGGDVTATSLYAGAGIGGGGNGGPGVDVVITGGTVTVREGAADSDQASAIGYGGNWLSTEPDWGSLSITAPGTVVIADGGTLRVPDGVVVTGDGYIRSGGADATVVNDGAIQQPTDNVDWSLLGVMPHNFLIAFDPNGGEPEQEVRVFATTFELGAREFPPNPSRDGFVFSEWNSEEDGTGDTITAGTLWSDDTTVYAQWTPGTVTTAAPAGDAIAGVPLDFDVHVGPAGPGPGVPMGSVQLFIDGQPIGDPVALDANGDATLSWPNPTVGEHTYRVEFITDGEWAGSATENLPITVHPAPTPTPTPPAPTPGPGPTPHPGGLASTGLDGGLLGGAAALALAAILLGAGLIRRRSSVE
ncbi:Ig-like domain repeat protein [Agromyces archimandritae]|uniref:Ig-like domain repeat protein n=1 Tax=Agromyces archimandritae TaxID=2781962 RepID=A0A975FKE6_9MICO|nr:Ig-like domain repeat protein [Agromyces archimandritae]QTX03599.1 Ig-like domain repeat protein [Agromyces archimandritae]